MQKTGGVGGKEIGGNITPLFLSRRFMKDFIVEEVLTYWEDLRQGRLVPRRSEIDPRKLRRSLNHTFVLESIAPDNIRFRLAGNKLCDAMGMEMRGMPAYAMIEQSGRNAFNETIQAALAHPEILDFQLSPSARMVLLPMADEDDALNRILGCINVDPDQPDFPTRFYVQSVTRTRIIAAQPIKPHLVTELDEDRENFKPKSKNTPLSKSPHLRIIK
jgi:hypothetical protein